MNPLLMVWNLEEVAVKPFANFYNEICMVLEASGCCCESIFDESRGGCCEAICKLLQRNIHGFRSFRRLRESISDGSESPGCCREAIYTLLQRNIYVFWKLQEAVGNPSLMVWNLQEVAVKPFTTLLQINIHGFVSFRRLL